jgi:hypothetical protein
MFGSGRRASRIMKTIGQGLEIAYVIDNDTSKWGKAVVINERSYHVCPPDVLKNENFDEVEIIVGSVNIDEMASQLKELSMDFAKQSYMKTLSVVDEDEMPFEIHIMAFSNSGILTVQHDYSTFEPDALIVHIKNEPCTIKFYEMLVNGGESDQFKKVFRTNGEWADEQTIVFANYNPTIYMEEHEGIDTIVAKFDFIETDYKNAYEFARNYYLRMEDFSNDVNPEYVPDMKYESMVFREDDVKPIAFYLPQFHGIPENDLWWEKGFTEWTHVTKAYPLFQGHYQPHLPIDLGFYDLKNIEVQKRQIELAKKYGIYGFCYYYYQYENKKLLDAPIKQHLANRDLDFPFCIMWANENWTKQWVGNDKELLITIGYSEAYYLEVIKDICVYLKDPRYICVDGKPLIIIYRIDNLKEPERFTKIWREYCRKERIGEIFLLYVTNDNSPVPKDSIFDGISEFNFRSDKMRDISYKLPFYSNVDIQKNKIIDYKRYIESVKHIAYKEVRYKAVFPYWDNTPRYHGRGMVFHGTSPKLYGEWLKHTISYTKTHHKSKDKYVFINAWNEWSEGAHLEPDRKYGYAYLHATRKAIEENGDSQ